MTKDETDNFVQMMMEEENFEDFLERFNVSPEEAIDCLIQSGLIDMEDMNELAGY